MQSALVVYPVLHVANCIGIPGITIPNASFDLQYLRDRRETALGPSEQMRAEQVVRSQKFQDWLRSPTSTRLLVHDNDNAAVPVSWLSFLCQFLADTLQERSDQFIHLVFFCGLHKDPQSGHTLIQSLIRQLLERLNRGLGILMSLHTLDCVQNGDLGALNLLFAHLMSLIPPSMTVCCLVDGASYYESAEVWDEVQFLLWPLFQISGQTSRTHADLKLLITSPRLTSHLREWFPHELTLFIASRG